MIPKEKIQSAYLRSLPNITDTAFNNVPAYKEGYLAGIKFAEQYLKGLVIEFGKYAYENHGGIPYSFEELFEIFLKEKYNK